MTRRLIFKLLAVTLLVIGFVMVVVWVSIDTLAASYFVTLMEKYNISPGPAHAMFVDAVHRYLLGASLAALVLAVLLSFLLLRRVLAPLTRMTAISREIAAGDFRARVPETSRDEVGQLARAFNHMSANLEKIENLRRSLMIDVAHELRTPLTNIRGYLEALNDGVVPPSPETFNLLLEETMRLAALVEDVLQLARADAARSALERRDVDLGQALDTALETFAPAFESRAVRVRVDRPAQPVVLALDPGRMARVLRNLVDNASRYTPAGGEVLIVLAARDGQARLEFSNPGAELTTQDLANIFERFYRGEKSRSRQHGGAGIGLSLVKELVEAHGGRVGAELDGDRLTVWLTLPLEQHTPQA